MDISAQAVNALADAFGAQLNAGTVELYGGTQPATADTATTGQPLILTLSLQNPAFGAAAGGVINLVTPNPVVSAVTETCTWARWKDSGGFVIMDTSVGTTGTDLTLTDNNIASGNTVTISTFSYTQPAD